MELKIAIEKAIEGGWQGRSSEKDNLGTLRYQPLRIVLTSGDYMYPVGEIFLDCSFWQCLGKTMGWEKQSGMANYVGIKKPELTGEWLYYWHRFIDHLAEGKSIQSYFKTL